MPTRKDLPIFLSYREDDGLPLARAVNRALHGRSFRTGAAVSSVVVFFDKTSRPAVDWEVLFLDEIKGSLGWILICTPGARTRFVESRDFLYNEIDWWVSNRPGRPPILLTPKLSHRWIPEEISKAWPKLNIIDVEMIDGDLSTDTVSRIIDGIVSDIHHAGPIGSAETEADQPFLYTWKKDKNLRYISCNENYAMAAGLDSPNSIVGKDDYQLPWRSLADYFREGDRSVIASEHPGRDHVLEKEIMVDRVADILVTETQLRSSNGKCIGVQGYFLDVTNTPIPDGMRWRTSSGGIRPGGELGQVELSVDDIDMLSYLLSNFPARYISQALSISTAETESRLNALLLKLQASSVGGVVDVAMDNRIPFLIDAQNISRLPWKKN